VFRIGKKLKPSAWAGPKPFKFAGPPLSLYRRITPLRSAHRPINPQPMRPAISTSPRVSQTGGAQQSTATSPSFLSSYSLSPSPALTRGAPPWKGVAVRPCPPPRIIPTRPDATSTVHPTYLAYISAARSPCPNPNHLGDSSPFPPPVTSGGEVEEQ
jgi:hypothetical protein